MTAINYTPLHLTTPELADAEHVEAALTRALRSTLPTYREHVAGLKVYAPFAQVDDLDILVDDMLRDAYNAGLQAGLTKAR